MNHLIEIKQGKIYFKKINKPININNIDEISSILYLGKTKFIKHFPFDDDTSIFLIINCIEINNIKQYQLIINLNDYKIYYRYKLFNDYINWIYLPIYDDYNDLYKNIKENFETLKINVLNKKTEIYSKINEICNFFNELEENQNYLSSILINDYNLYSRYKKSCIACFVDDDTNKYIKEIWDEICDENNIKIGFACITGINEGTIISNRVEDEQIDLSYLKSLYDKGFDIYSHSYSHKYFYEFSTNKRVIKNECILSKKFLLKNRFFRSSDIIVYPGGLGTQRYLKKRVIKKYFRYGVDTIGYGINNNIDNYCLYRYNLDTSRIDSLFELINKVSITNSLLIFMSHSYELNKNKIEQVNKINNTILYMKEKNIIILPLSEALKIKNYTKNKDYKFKNFNVITCLKEMYMDIKSILNNYKIKGESK